MLKSCYLCPDIVDFIVDLVLIVLVFLHKFLLKLNSLFMLILQLHVQLKHLVLLLLHSLENLFGGTRQSVHVSPIIRDSDVQLLLLYESGTINIFNPFEYFAKEVHTCQGLSVEQDVFQI